MPTAEWRNRDRVEYAKLETAAPAYVDDSYYYWAFCEKCKRTARLSLVKLRARLGDDFRSRTFGGACAVAVVDRATS